MVISKGKETGLVKDLRAKVNKLVAEVESLRVQTSATVKVHRTSKGTVLHVLAKPARPAQGIQWKGEWSTQTEYSTDDLVKVSLGPGAGLYLVTKTPIVYEDPVSHLKTHDPACLPWKGEYYAQLAQLDAQNWN